MGLRELAYSAQQLVKAKSEIEETYSSLLFMADHYSSIGYPSCVKTIWGYSEELIQYLVNRLEEDGFDVSVSEYSGSGVKLEFNWEDSNTANSPAYICYKAYTDSLVSQDIQDTFLKAFEETIRDLSSKGRMGFYIYLEEDPILRLSVTYGRERVLQELSKYFVVREGTFSDVYIEWSKDV